MLQRRIASAGNGPALLHSRLASYPAVALVGPRQCGKTTLARSLGGRYYDLEQAADRLRLDLEWADVTASDELVILDEAQADAEVFARLRGAIDADRRRNGRFLLLGSVAPSLMMSASESLAGRLSVVQLTPLSLGELDGADARSRLWLCGGYPDGGVVDGAGFPQWQHDYLDLLSQRDLPAWGLPARPPSTRRLFRMLAAGHGQVWNASWVGASWEGHVIDQIITALLQAGRHFDAWHLRTADGRETDLVLRVGSQLWAVEAKLTTRPTRGHMARLNECADLIGADRRFLVSRLPGVTQSGAQTVCDLPTMVSIAAAGRADGWSCGG